MNKFLPEYLEDICKAGAASAEALKEVCKKLDLILEAIYSEEETDVTETAETADNNEDNEEPAQDVENADNKQVAEKKKRGRKPKK